MSFAVPAGKEWEARLGCSPPAPKLGALLVRADLLAVTEARRRLEESPYADVRRIECESRDGAVALAGRVSSFFQKQMALAAVAQLVPMEHIRDEIVVVQTVPTT